MVRISLSFKASTIKWWPSVNCCAATVPLVSTVCKVVMVGGPFRVVGGSCGWWYYALLPTFRGAEHRVQDRSLTSRVATAINDAIRNLSSISPFRDVGGVPDDWTGEPRHGRCRHVGHDRRGS